MEIKKSELETSQEFGAIIREHHKDRLEFELHYISSENIYLETLEFKRTNISYIRILNRWNRICLSFDFLRHEAQGALNGQLSEKVTNLHAIALEDTVNNETFKAKFMSMSVGRYYFDKNPLIGKMVNINIWNRTMDSEELIKRTQCNETFVDNGSIINRFSEWHLSGTLTKNISVNANETNCIKKRESKNVFFPISALSKSKAESLCKKIGQQTFIAGNFESREDFDNYYDDLFLNRRFVKFCGHSDNGRLVTWIPYKMDVDKREFIHDKSMKPLLFNQVEKYYVPWYQGPKEVVNKDHFEGLCGAAYFGIVEKYRNLYQDDCRSKKCTTCEIPTSPETTPILSLRGLCEHSFLDKVYQVHYDPESQIHYVGKEKSVIKYDFQLKVWIIRNANNINVKAISSAPFSSLAIGTFVWNITNDTRCSTEDSSISLSLSGCNEEEFSCNNGLCIDIENRSDLKYLLNEFNSYTINYVDVME